MEANRGITDRMPPAAIGCQILHSGFVDAARLADWLEDAEVLLVDVREPREFERSRIAGSFLVPLSRFDLHTFPRVDGLKMVVICQNGFLSPGVGNELRAAGYPDVYVLDGGLGAWVSAGFELEE